MYRIYSVLGIAIMRSGMCTIPSLFSFSSVCWIYMYQKRLIDKKQGLNSHLCMSELDGYTSLTGWGILCSGNGIQIGCDGWRRNFLYSYGCKLESGLPRDYVFAWEVNVVARRSARKASVIAKIELWKYHFTTSLLDLALWRARQHYHCFCVDFKNVVIVLGDLHCELGEH